MARVGSSTNPSSSNSLGCPRPLDSEKDAMGQGGCTAYALAKAFGVDKSELVAMLDNEMDTVYAMLNAQRPPSKPYPKDWVGTKGRCWHYEVIRLALKNNFTPWRFRKVKIGPRMFEKGKKYLVIGYLNEKSVGPPHPQNGGTLYGEEGKQCEDPEQWRHSILVEGPVTGGKFHCAGIAALGGAFSSGSWPNKYLWLDPKTGRPDRRKGYMKLIKRVYEI